MQYINLALRTFIAAFALIALYMLLSSGCSAGKNSGDTKPAGSDPDKLYSSIPVKEINRALAKSKNKKIVLNIYPVKLSQDIAAKDFALQVASMDADEPGANLGKTIDNEKFMQQAGWYVNYLKEQQLSREKIPYGYFIDIVPELLQNKESLDVWVFTKASQMQYTFKFIAGKDTSNNPCKCPPECCYPTLSLASDSMGRCPPDCRRTPLLLSREMEKVIASVYKKD